MSQGQPEQSANVLFVAAQAGACAWYRCVTPAAALVERGYAVSVVNSFTERELEAADVVVAQRVAHPVMLEAFDFVKRRGGLTVYDVDDDLWNIDPTNPAHDYWSRDEPQHLAANLIRAADLTTTTTPALAERLKRFTKNVRILPNMLPDQYWPAQPKSLDHDDPVVIGWAGSATHHADFKAMGGVLKQILDRYPNVEVHLAGALPNWIEPHYRVRHLQPVSIEQYAGILAGFDIGVAPLALSRFNHCKSDLKALEYSMIGLPVVASRTDPYAAFIKHGTNGLLATNPKDWLKCLCRLVEDSSLREELARAARSAAERRLISKNIRMYEDAYGLEAVAEAS